MKKTDVQKVLAHLKTVKQEYDSDYELGCAIAICEADLARVDEPVEPSVEQLIAQLHDNQKWTVAEQQQFAVFLKRFPNESSQGIISLGYAWKYGKACATPQEAVAPGWLPIESAQKDAEPVIVKLCNWEPAITTAIFRDGNWWRDNNGYGYTIHCEPLGWMPIPQEPTT